LKGEIEMKHTRVSRGVSTLLPAIFCFGFSFLSFGQSIEQKIIVREQELATHYQEYFETKIQLSNANTQAVHWKVAAQSLPDGLYLEETVNSEITLFGTPTFSGEWCFALKAEVDSGSQSTKRICLYGQEPENSDSLQFATGEVLTFAEPHAAYSEKIEFRSTDFYPNGKVEVIDGALPAGIDIAFSDQEQALILSGTTQSEGVFTFALRITDTNEKTLSRQFILTSRNRPQNRSEHSCAPGYTFDEDLRYCVPGNLDHRYE
jgi:hypothetical protein